MAKRSPPGALPTSNWGACSTDSIQIRREFDLVGLCAAAGCWLPSRGWVPGFIVLMVFFFLFSLTVSFPLQSEAAVFPTSPCRDVRRLYRGCEACSAGRSRQLYQTLGWHNRCWTKAQLPKPHCPLPSLVLPKKPPQSAALLPFLAVTKIATKHSTELAPEAVAAPVQWQGNFMVVGESHGAGDGGDWSAAGVEQELCLHQRASAALAAVAGNNLLAFLPGGKWPLTSVVCFIPFRQLTKEAGRDTSQQTKTGRALQQPNGRTCHLTEVRHRPEEGFGPGRVPALPPEAPQIGWQTSPKSPRCRNPLAGGVSLRAKPWSEPWPPDPRVS